MGVMIQPPFFSFHPLPKSLLLRYPHQSPSQHVHSVRRAYALPSEMSAASPFRLVLSADPHPHRMCLSVSCVHWLEPRDAASPPPPSSITSATPHVHPPPPHRHRLSPSVSTSPNPHRLIRRPPLLQSRLKSRTPTPCGSPIPFLQLSRSTVYATPR